MSQQTLDCGSPVNNSEMCVALSAELPEHPPATPLTTFCNRSVVGGYEVAKGLVLILLRGFARHIALIRVRSARSIDPKAKHAVRFDIHQSHMAEKFRDIYRVQIIAISE